MSCCVTKSETSTTSTATSPSATFRSASDGSAAWSANVSPWASACGTSRSTSRRSTQDEPAAAVDAVPSRGSEEHLRPGERAAGRVLDQQPLPGLEADADHEERRRPHPPLHQEPRQEFPP